jgi:hypothetical protein
VDTTRNLWWRANDETAFANSKWHQIAFTYSNVASATKLQTSRTIWGQSFDGTGDVNGQITNHDSFVIDAADYYNSYRSRGLIFLANGVEAGGVYGFGAGKNLSDITITASGGRGNGQGIMLFKNGNVVIGGTTADAKLAVVGSIDVYERNGDYSGVIGFNRKSAIGGLYNLSFDGWQISNHNGSLEFLCEPTSGAAGFPLKMTRQSVSITVDTTINGNLLTTGAITMFSQLSMKNVIDYDVLSLAQLEQIHPARFTWKDGRDNRTHVGCIADYIQPILPEVVYETVNKELTVDYGSAAFYIGASLIKPVIDHEKRIKELETRVESLENENR